MKKVSKKVMRDAEKIRAKHKDLVRSEVTSIRWSKADFVTIDAARGTTPFGVWVRSIALAAATDTIDKAKKKRRAG